VPSIPKTSKPLRTRFAPSPTGLLHVGNAYSALQCQRWAEQQQAELLLRIEDIDHTRCRPAFADAMIEDLQWLGLRWHEISYQHERLHYYQDAMAQLRSMGAVYPCFCTRKQIEQEINRMACAPHADDITMLYPGTCKQLSAYEQQQRMQHQGFAWRLNMDRALAFVGGGVSWLDGAGVRHAAHLEQDIIIGRKDIGVSYHLAVVVDDAMQGISHIIRGCDLAASTGIHRLLQGLLGLPEPVYMHHALLLDHNGKRLAKRNQATTLSSLRQQGVEAQPLREMLNSDTPPRWPLKGIGQVH